MGILFEELRIRDILGSRLIESPEGTGNAVQMSEQYSQQGPSATAAFSLKGTFNFLKTEKACVFEKIKPHPENIGDAQMMDVVTSLHLPYIPEDAWRDRKNCSEYIRRQIVSAGCHLVPKCPPCYEDKDARCVWRLSFSVAECILAKYRTPVQHACFLIAKSIFYVYVKTIQVVMNYTPLEVTDIYEKTDEIKDKDTNFNDKVNANTNQVNDKTTNTKANDKAETNDNTHVSNMNSRGSYVLKTVMMWMIQETEPDIRKEDNIDYLVDMMFARLHECLQTRTLPNFFIPELNLLTDYPVNLLDKTCAKVGEIRENVQCYIPENIESLVAKGCQVNTVLNVGTLCLDSLVHDSDC